MHRWLVGFGWMALASGHAFAATTDCGLPKISGSRELQAALSLRAVELIKRAANSDDGQAALVAPTATFSLGAGDVGRSLGTGVAGARELARTMNADTYRFLGWDYMDEPAIACSKRKVEVEFIDSQAKTLSRVEFTFDLGRVVNAAGWQRSFETGLLEDNTAR